MLYNAVYVCGGRMRAVFGERKRFFQLILMCLNLNISYYKPSKRATFHSTTFYSAVFSLIPLEILHISPSITYYHTHSSPSMWSQASVQIDFSNSLTTATPSTQPFKYWFLPLIQSDINFLLRSSRMSIIYAQFYAKNLCSTIRRK